MEVNKLIGGIPNPPAKDYQYYCQGQQAICRTFNIWHDHFYQFVTANNQAFKFMPRIKPELV
jgi:hypothetical protein